MNLVINGRFTHQRLTGVQRYAREVTARLNQNFKLITPPDHPIFFHGPFWEQLWLPFLVKSKDLLWSPTNTGPLAVSNQVLTLHDLSPLDHPEWFSQPFAAWYGLLLPRLVQRVRKIITDSHFTRGRLAEVLDLPVDRVEIVPLGVSPAFFPQPAEEQARLRGRLQLNSPYLLSLGSLEPRKNLSRLLQAWRLVSAQIPDVELLIAGEMGYPFKDPVLGNLPSGVRLLGRVSDQDLPALYSGALAFIYPSVYEGFGLPPLEAMACGTPVVVSNATSLPEVVGYAGILFDPFNVEEMAFAIERVIMDSTLRQNLRQKGLERAQQFTWERTAQQVWEVLQWAVDESD
jgi:glycosyltransferase involved in cell wall biosynthesis